MAPGLTAEQKRALLREASEIAAGVLVVAVVGFFAVRAFTGEGVGAQPGYLVTAQFDRVDGLREAVDVRLGGIKIGSVAAIGLDRDNRATVSMIVRDEVRMPIDSTAQILSDSLFGAKYIEIEPGAEETMMASGDAFQNVQNALALPELLELIISQGRARQSAQGKAPEAPAAPL